MNTATINLAKKAIINYAQEHYGWSAKYHPEDYEKWQMLMEAVGYLESLKGVRDDDTGVRAGVLLRGDDNVHHGNVGDMEQV